MNQPLNASAWTTDNKKRVPTIGGYRTTAPRQEPESDVYASEPMPPPPSIDDTARNNTQTSTRVAALLEHLTANNDGDKLSNYVPLEHPKITVNRKETPPAVEHARFSANDINLANLSNYNQTYNTQKLFQGAHAKIGGGGDDKLTEKINYMIHLLEEQQMEKTANVTEEFILYILLGVFVIFTVDSFTRVGKYVR